MRKKKWDWLLIAHALIIIWALLFVYSIYFRAPDGGKMASILAVGNFFGLFISIPLAVVSLTARAKKKFSEKLSIPVILLSILNICVGIADWIFVFTLWLHFHTA